MRLGFAPLLLLSALLPAAAAAPVSPLHEEAHRELTQLRTGEVPAVSTAEELNTVLKQAVERLDDYVAFRPGGTLRPEQLRPMLLNSAVRDEVTGFSAAVGEESGEVRLKIHYHDGTRMAASRRFPERDILTEEERQALAELDARTEQLCRPGMTDYEKLLALHDDLIRRCTYRDDEQTESGSVVGLVRTGEGHCSAYTRTLKLMLDKVGIPNLYAQGTSEGIPHVWNLVFVEGAWRHVDCTWDDPRVPKGTEPQILHEFFCVSDADMPSGHQWDRSRLPAVTQDPPLYLNRMGMYHRSYQEFWLAAEAAAERGEESYTGFLTVYESHARLTQEARRYMEEGGKLRLYSLKGEKVKQRATVTVYFEKLR